MATKSERLTSWADVCLDQLDSIDLSHVNVEASVLDAGADVAVTFKVQFFFRFKCQKSELNIHH